MSLSKRSMAKSADDDKFGCMAKFKEAGGPQMVPQKSEEGEWADKCEELNCTDDALELMAQHEEVASRGKLVRRQAVRPSDIAGKILLWRICQRMQAHPARFFESAMVFASCSPGEEAMELHVTMARAAASFLLCSKFSEVQTPIYGRQNAILTFLTTSASRASTMMGGQEVTCEMILNEERRILVKHPQSLTLPSVLSWLEVFMSRLDIATDGAMKPKMNEAMAMAQQMAATCVCYGPAPSATNAPRTWAVGILGLALAALGLVGLDGENGGAPRGCLQPPAPGSYEARLVSDALEFAAMMPMVDIKHAVNTVVEVQRHWSELTSQFPGMGAGPQDDTRSPAGKPEAAKAAPASDASAASAARPGHD
jgi:hypothetical protein